MIYISKVLISSKLKQNFQINFKNGNAHAKIFNLKRKVIHVIVPGFFLISDSELQGAGSLLRKYITLLCNHVSDILPRGASLAANSSKHFSLVSKIIVSDVTGILYFRFNHTVTYHQNSISQLQSNLSSSQLRNRVNMTSKGSWVFNTGHFTIKLNTSKNFNEH